jgi:hypothetical protein
MGRDGFGVVWKLEELLWHWEAEQGTDLIRTVALQDALTVSGSGEQTRLYGTDPPLCTL